MDRTYYVFCDCNVKAEAYSKEQFLAILQQAIENGDLDAINPDAGIITKIKGQVTNNTLNFGGVMTQATFNSMKEGGTLTPNTIYIMSDDTSRSSLQAAIEDCRTMLNQIGLGLVSVPNATNATKLNNIQTLNGRTLVDGDTVISYKKLLWSGSADIAYDGINGDKTICTLNGSAFSSGDTIRVFFKPSNMSAAFRKVEFKISDTGLVLSNLIDVYSNNNHIIKNVLRIRIITQNNTTTIKGAYYAEDLTGGLLSATGSPVATEIYKVIG